MSGREDSGDDDDESNHATPEFLKARSAVSEGSHREPVTSVDWIVNNDSTPPSSWDVVSFGSDGRVLVWDYTKTTDASETGYGDSERSENKRKNSARRVPFPRFGWETKSANASGKNTTHGISAASFFGSTKDLDFAKDTRDANEPSRSDAMGDLSNQFLVGSDVGCVFECVARGYTAFSSNDFYKKRMDKTGNSGPCVLKSPIVATYEPHAGSVHAVHVNRFSDTLFASVGADGALKIHHRAKRKKLCSLEPKAGGLFACEWSPTKPLLVAIGTSCGTVVLYDLSRAVGSGDGDGDVPSSIPGAGVFSLGGLSALAPAVELTGCVAGTPTQAVAFNTKIPEYLASADGNGVRIWNLGGRFSCAGPGEREALRRLVREDVGE